jgi:exodeoxyribonuclease VII small subunit
MTAKEEAFEASLGKLEEVVRHLESGDLTLDDSLIAFERGIKLAKKCEKNLNEAQAKVDILIKSEGGKAQEQPFKEEG